jgi:tetratricopeptide (TPR) repeat protein
VLREATTLALPEIEAMAYQDIGAALEEQGRRVEALEAKYQAFLLTGDTLQRMRVLGDLGNGLAELGEYTVARLAFEIVADSKSSFLVRTNAIIELMELESATGNRLAFERRRAAAQAARDRMPPSMTADYLFKLGVGLARFGQASRGRDILESGLVLSETHRLNTWYFRFEGVLQNFGDCEIREPEVTTPVRSIPSSAVREMEFGLREYASSAS